MQVLKQILEEIESLGREHPYKILGIPDTYSQENKGKGIPPQERVRNAVRATGNKWAIENFNATHN